MLIVDDDLQIKKIIKSVATALGAKDIALANNGKEQFDLQVLLVISGQQEKIRSCDLRLDHAADVRHSAPA